MTTALEKDDLVSTGVQSPRTATSASSLSEKNETPQLESNAEEPGSYLTGAKLWIFAATLGLGGFLITLDASIITTAIPTITSAFNSIEDVGWYGAAFLIANCSFQPSAGKLYQYYAPKWTFMTFLAIFELGSVLCGVATSSNMLIVGRAVAGLGGSGLMNGALTMIGSAAPPDKRPMLLGTIMSVSMTGMVAGPLIGGVFTENVSWRWCFYINLPLGALMAFVLLFITLPDHRTSHGGAPTLRQAFWRLDLPGFAIFAPACTMLLLALQWGGNTYAWNSATIIGLFCGAGATAIVFGLWETYQGDDAMIPAHLVKQRVIAASVLTQAFQMGGIQIFLYYLPEWFQVVKNASPEMSGVYLLPTLGTQVIFSILSAALLSRVGFYLPFIMFGSSLCIICYGLLTTLTPDTSTADWVGYQILRGVGTGTGMQHTITAIQLVLSARDLPVGTALLVFGQFLGGAIFVALGQTIFQNVLKSKLAEYAPDVDFTLVVEAGAADLRSTLTSMGLGSEIDGVVEAYDLSLTYVFYLALGAAVATLLANCGLEWRSVKKKPEPATAEA